MKSLNLDLKSILIGIILTIMTLFVLGFSGQQDKTNSDYAIVADDNIPDLSRRVKEYIQNDYKVQGGVFVFFDQQTSKHIFYQTVCR